MAWVVFFGKKIGAFAERVAASKAPKLTLYCRISFFKTVGLNCLSGENSFTQVYY